MRWSWLIFPLGLLGCSPKLGVVPPAEWAHAGAGLETTELSLANGARLQALRFDQARYQLKLLSPEGGVHVPADIAPADALAIWNGGYCRSLTCGRVAWWSTRGVRISPPSNGSALLLLGDRFLALVRFREGAADEVARERPAALAILDRTGRRRWNSSATTAKAGPGAARSDWTMLGADYWPVSLERGSRSFSS